MNRADRRRSKSSGGLYPSKSTVMTGLLNKTKKPAFDESALWAFQLMLAIPVMILRDKFEFSKEQSEEFVSKGLYYYDSLEQGLITMEELHECLWEEAGIKIESR